jgi:hypothetical protein
MEEQSVSKTDEDARDRAEQIIKDALRVIMEGTSFSPQDRDCPRLRAQIGVRCIATILFGLSEAYQLDADLRAALFDVATGEEAHLPEYVRRMWDDPQFFGQHDPPDNVQ